jgi:hypothetical protein
MNDFLDIEDLSEEDLDAILGLGTAEDEAAQLENQLAMASKLRNQAGPEGRGYGGIYTAASPIEHAVHAWQGIKAGKDAEKISGEQDALMQRQNDARQRFFEAMMRRQQPQPQQNAYGPEALANPGVY